MLPNKDPQIILLLLVARWLTGTQMRQYQLVFTTIRALLSFNVVIITVSNPNNGSTNRISPLFYTFNGVSEEPFARAEK